MKTSSLQFLLLLVVVVVVRAQDKITDVLATDDKLSSLRSILVNNPALAQVLDDKSYGQRTFLAPSDTALAKFDANTNATTGSGGVPTQTQVEAMLSYHILNGSFPASSLNSPGGVAATTYLQDSQYANLPGGVANVVYASQYGSSGAASTPSQLQVFGGIGGSAPIVRTDIKFANGYVHVVDDLLALPETCTSSMNKLSLSSLLTALTRASLSQTLDSTPGVTCFAPSQEAFAALGNPEDKLSSAELSGALMYHTLGKATYSPELKQGTNYPTLQIGKDLGVVREGGNLYITNGGGGKAKVLKGNVMVKNGVMHVIDTVLTPSPANPGNGTGSNGTTSTTRTTTTGSATNAPGTTTTAAGKNGGQYVSPPMALLFTAIGVVFSVLF